ncbi:hypothetical protein CYMTET_20800 [Cymbomonas tetramitiformis]|uniref:Uncharacterized protein n=1 Tax=Cymbomonas tetramitiformis TaxID=36881 RepID=A0AAE0G3K6_9CHLO|nr:hypothetical protein CYMTET_20800 [Cymbomonas tetramitiformis]
MLLKLCAQMRLQPSNMYTLVSKMLEYLNLATEEHEAAGTATAAHDVPQILNCLRILSRVLPFIYEGMSLTAQNSTQVVPNTALQINFDALTKLLLRLLFCGALTIPLYSAQNTCLWASGIGPGKARPEASQLLFKTARVELLRCLVATGCESIFLTASTYVTAQRIALSALANNLTAWNAERGRLEAQPQANNLFASLLNTVCTSEDAGPGLFSSGGKTTDSYLMEYSVHVLLLLLDYPESDVPPVYNAPDPSVSGDPYMKLVAPVATPSAATVSVFRDLWLRIQAWPELKFVNQGLVRHLQKPFLASTSSSLFLNRPKVECCPELMVLTWRLLSSNPGFLRCATSRDCEHGMPLLQAILQHIHHYRTDPSKLGLVQSAVFVLLLLSGCRDFAAGLNLQSPPSIYPGLELSHGCTHGDALVQLVYQFVVTGGGHLVPLYKTILTVLVNVTPFVKALYSSSAEKMLHMLEIFSAPRVMFKAENNFQWTHLLLQSVNNLLQYQIDGNVHLVYCILRRSDSVHALVNLVSLDTALVEHPPIGNFDRGEQPQN